MNFYEVITELKGSGSKNQENFLRTHCQDNDVHKELFRVMLSPEIMYFIKKVPDEPQRHHAVIGGTIIRKDIDLLARLYVLIRDGLRGDSLKAAVQDIWNACDYEHQEILSWVLDRKNPAKIGKSIVNKVWPDLIRTQLYMGAVPGTPEALDRLPWEHGVAVQVKEDGMTFLVDYQDGMPISIHTRPGQDITRHFPGFLRSCRVVPGFCGMVHHEALVYDSEAEEYLDRATGNGLINKHIKNGKTSGGVDDCIQTVLLDVFNSTHPDMEQDDRYWRLNDFVSPVSRRVRQLIYFSKESAKEFAQEVIRGGGEGAIAKAPTQPFKNGKPWYCVKMKNEFTCELEVIDTKPHSKKPDELGALLCTSKDRKLEVWVNLRCDADRLTPPNEVQGAIVQVRAESIIESKTKSKASLYLPRMDGKAWDEYVRPDKTWADTTKQIQAAYKASKM
jgi:hypothetical protein